MLKKNKKFNQKKKKKDLGKRGIGGHKFQLGTPIVPIQIKVYDCMVQEKSS